MVHVFNREGGLTLLARISLLTFPFLGIPKGTKEGRFPFNGILSSKYVRKCMNSTLSL